MGGGKEMHSLQDLIKFPWESDEPSGQPTDEEIRRLQEQVQRENEEYLRRKQLEEKG